MREIKIVPLTKNLLGNITGYSRQKLSNELKALHVDLKKEFPRYNQFSKILPDNLFFWLCEEFGLNENEIISRIKKFTPEYHSISDEEIRKIYGLKWQNSSNLL